MIRLTSKYKIGDLIWNGVISTEISSSYDQLTDTCTIEFPRRVSWQGKDLASGDNPLIRRGDAVEIELGYDDNNKSVFKGYVRQIKTNSPVEVVCEDEAYKLKQGAITKSYKDVDLKTLLQDTLGDIPFMAPDIRLGPFRVSKATPAKVLQYLKEKYFLKSFFRDGVLYVGLAVWPELQRKATVRFDLHVVENNLEYQKSEDIKIKLKLINMTKDNKKEEYEFGDPDGEQRTMHYYDLSSKEINKIGAEQVERLKYEGYRGTVTIFGEPQFRHGDIVEFIDPFYPERDGSYIIKQVSTSFGLDGYRQVLTPDIKVA